MNRLLSVLAIAGAVFAVPAVAQPAQKRCTKIELMLGFIGARPEIEKHVVLRGTELLAARGIVIENAPNIADTDIANIIILYLADGRGIVLVGDTEKVCYAFELDKDQLRAFDYAVRGRPA
jgi:hypothetical protein